MHPYHGWPFLAASNHPLLSALWEVLVHGSLGLVAVAPIVWRSRSRRLAVLAFIGGIALDVDHAIAAGSLSPSAMEQLSHRPATHSLLFALCVALVALALTRRPILAWSLLAVLVAHLLFDAPGGGVRFLFPLRHPDAIPWLVCPIGIALLGGISALAARSLSPPHSHPVDDHARRKPRARRRRLRIGSANG
jgi:membrane-bound metal-dependent hydrolase YbcI (DUF457 family)